MKKKSLNKLGMKINGNSFLLMVTVLLFIVSTSDRTPFWYRSGIPGILS